jgi:hypothetical protein
MRCLAADSDYYQQYLRFVDTNSPSGIAKAALEDTNNKAPKLANTVLSLQKMREQGQIGNIHLGMTMDEVVARWGKPFGLYPMCGNRFYFSDCNLYFQGNSLHSVYLNGTPLFDHGLSVKSNLKQWTQVLGQPSSRHDDAQGSTLAYETRGAIHTGLFLMFDPDGDMKVPPTLHLDPLTNWFKPTQP